MYFKGTTKDNKKTSSLGNPNSTCYCLKNEVNVHWYLFVNLLILVSPDCSILVPEFGYMHLELIPMLVGFFTYKIATFAQAIEEAITVATRKT